MGIISPDESNENAERNNASWRAHKRAMAKAEGERSGGGIGGTVKERVGTVLRTIRMNFKKPAANDYEAEFDDAP